MGIIKVEFERQAMREFRDDHPNVRMFGGSFMGFSEETGGIMYRVQLEHDTFPDDPESLYTIMVEALIDGYIYHVEKVDG